MLKAEKEQLEQNINKIFNKAWRDGSIPDEVSKFIVTIVYLLITHSFTCIPPTYAFSFSRLQSCSRGRFLEIKEYREMYNEYYKMG